MSDEILKGVDFTRLMDNWMKKDGSTDQLLRELIHVVARLEARVGAIEVYSDKLLDGILRVGTKVEHLHESN